MKHSYVSNPFSAHVLHNVHMRKEGGNLPLFPLLYYLFGYSNVDENKTKNARLNKERICNKLKLTLLRGMLRSAELIFPGLSFYFIIKLRMRCGRNKSAYEIFQKLEPNYISDIYPRLRFDL